MKSPNKLVSCSSLVVASLTASLLSTPLAFGQDTVIQEWNFTGGSLVSEQGQPTGFFGSGAVVPDDGTDDQYLVTRGDGNSGSVPLGTSVSAGTADLLTVSITLSDFNFSVNNDQLFGVKFRQGTTTIADVRYDGQTAAQSGSIDRMRLTGLAVAGIALNTTASSEPITYGLTLNFADNSYTYWIGTPSSDETTWVSRFANHTGAIDLSSVSIDGLQWSIANSAVGNQFNLDQIQVFSSIVPEPSIFALSGLGALGLFLIRRRR